MSLEWEDVPRILTAIGLASVAATLATVAVTIVFLLTSDPVPGTVSRVDGWTQCVHDRQGTTTCHTEFEATVRYELQGPGQIRVPAGSARGRDRPVSEATLRGGDAYAVRASRAVSGWAYGGSSAELFDAWWFWGRFPLIPVVASVVFGLVTVRPILQRRARGG